MQNKLVSIVLPTFNGKKYIEDSINSILNQTYKNFELIIINDASTDETLDIVNKFTSKDARIKVFSNDTNKKLPRSLNIGFGHAKGDYFTWTSDDNIYLPNALETMVKELDQNPNLSFVFSCEKFIDESGKVLGERSVPKDLDDIYSKNIISACFLYTKEVHVTLDGYDENKFLVEDYDFFLRAYMNFEFKYISDSLYLYREHGASLTATKRELVKNMSINLLKEYLKKTDDKKIESKIKKGLSCYYLDLSDIYFMDVKRLGYKVDFYNLLKKRFRLFISELIK